MDGEELAARSIEQARRHANQQWMLEVERVIRDVSIFAETFTTDEVWHGLRTRAANREHYPQPHEPRAMGSVMRILHQRGVIEPTGVYRRSARPEAHCGPKREWRRADTVRVRVA